MFSNITIRFSINVEIDLITIEGLRLFHLGSFSLRYNKVEIDLITIEGLRHGR